MITKDMFIEKCTNIFPEYDFSNIIWKGYNISTSILCKKHGNFEIEPRKLYQQRGRCPKCRSEIMSKKNKQNAKSRLEKAKQTNLKNRGVENVFQDILVKQKIKDTSIKKYGGIGMASPEIAKKIAKTKEERYGDPYFTNREKCKKTVQDRYHTDNVYAAQEIIEKKKQTYLERYGEDNPMKVPEIKEKAKNTCIEKYGYDNPAKNEEIKQKMHDTLWQNGGYTRAEDRCYLELIKLYPEAIRNYKSEKYPYKCDFYIPSEDLYIELNAFYMHGGHWYNENDPKDAAQVEKWRDQNTEQSLYAIHIWTESDIAKKKCAEENNLNYLVFWSEEEFMEWLKGEK